MNNELMNQGLMIAAIGMGLVFVVIIFLWGLMALLMRLTSGKDTPKPEAALPEMTDTSIVPEFERTERQRRAAAAAVAVGLALASSRKPSAEASSRSTKGEVSPWQAFHRSRQINPQQR